MVITLRCVLQHLQGYHSRVSYNWGPETKGDLMNWELREAFFYLLRRAEDRNLLPAYLTLNGLLPTTLTSYGVLWRRINKISTDDRWSQRGKLAVRAGRQSLCRDMVEFAPMVCEACKLRNQRRGGMSGCEDP